MYIEDLCDETDTTADEALIMLKELWKSLRCFGTVRAEKKEAPMFKEAT